MTDEERQRIREAAHKHALEAAAKQGLPPVVTDEATLRNVAAIINAATARANAA